MFLYQRPPLYLEVCLGCSWFFCELIFVSIITTLFYTFAMFDTFDRTKRQENTAVQSDCRRDTHTLDTNDCIIPQIIFILFICHFNCVGLILAHVTSYKYNSYVHTYIHTHAGFSITSLPKVKCLRYWKDKCSARISRVIGYCALYWLVITFPLFQRRTMKTARSVC